MPNALEIAGGIVEEKKPQERRIELFAEIVLEPETPQIVRGLLDHRGFGLLFGKYGSGKTYVALSLLYDIVAGRSAWAGLSLDGIPDEKRGVIYIALEGFRGPRRRILALAGGLPPDRVMNRLALYRHADINLATEDAFAGSLRQKLDRHCARVLGMDVEDFLRRVDDAPELRTQHGACLLCVDTLARACPSLKENDAGEVGAFVRVCDRLRQDYDVAVLVVHHTGKDEDRGSRGSSALPSAVDVALHVKREDDIVKIEADKAPKEELPGSARLRFRLVPTRLVDPVSSEELEASKAVPITAMRPPETWEKVVILIEHWTSARDERGPTVAEASKRLGVSAESVRRLADRRAELETYHAVTASGKPERGFRLRLKDLGKTEAHRLRNDPDIDPDEVDKLLR